MLFVLYSIPFIFWINTLELLQQCFSLCHALSMANFSTASLAFSEGSYGDDSGLAVYVAKAIDPSLCWDDITWLKANTHLPVILKGILNGTHTLQLWLIISPSKSTVIIRACVSPGEDAVQAVNCGADGIVVSNHGARQLDGVPATVCVPIERFHLVARLLCPAGFVHQSALICASHFSSDQRRHFQFRWMDRRREC